MKEQSKEQRSKAARETKTAAARDRKHGGFDAPALASLGRRAAKDAIAGLVGSVVLIGNVVSFAALMFPGELSAGIPIAIWAMLVGSALGGICIALMTSIPPLSTGIDSPTGAFLVLLSASTGAAVLHSGGTVHAAVPTVMLVFTAATLVAGALFLLVGAMRWGSYFRFVPYFVVGGFLAATGWFLVAGGIRMTTGITLSLQGLARTSLTLASGAKLGSAIAVLLVLLALRRFSRSALAMPTALLAMVAVGGVALHALGIAREHGWYLPSLGALKPWSPIEAAQASALSWPIVGALAPELVAVAMVAVISLVTKVASLELARQAAGNLDAEFRAHGVGNLLAAPFGGIVCHLQTGTSRLLEQVGGARMSGVACSLAMGAVAVAHLDLPALIPLPIVAGLLFYLGCTFVVDALARPIAQRAWADLVLVLAITGVCIRYGYLIGVLAGLVGACVMFALNYARIGVVRRHATRALYASHVDRSREAAEHLRRNGDAIQIYWLAGYIFFGSSEGLFERVRVDVESLPRGPVTHVVLDFAMVSGGDSSAMSSLAKLRNFCDRHRVTLVYCSLSPGMRSTLGRAGFFGGRSRHQAFASLDLGVAWCEDRLVAEAALERGGDLAGFELWLERQLGTRAAATQLMAYLQRRRTEPAQVLYRQGEPADSIDLVASGSLTIDIATPDGQSMRVRRTMTHTMLGEMGFVRRSVRSATVSSEGSSDIFSLSREGFERMRRERPELADAFADFVMRTLADRLDSANRAAAALAG